MQHALWLILATGCRVGELSAARVADFAKIVLTQDGDACEMNQRGIASPAYERGRLMPEEYEIHRFHGWVLNQMEGER